VAAPGNSDSPDSPFECEYLWCLSRSPLCRTDVKTFCSRPRATTIPLPGLFVPFGHEVTLPRPSNAREFHPSGWGADRFLRYLARINAGAPKLPSYPYLAELLACHLFSVPYDAVDIYFGVPMRLDFSYFYDEVVELRSGGVCVELNGLFYQLLSWLGFDVTMVGGEVFQSSGHWAPPLSHLVLLVILDRPYLVDVGYGDFCRIPLPFAPGASLDDGVAHYTLEHEPLRDEYTVVQKRHYEPTPPRALYRFTPVPRELQEFLPGYDHLVHDPDSVLRRRLTCGLPSPQGRVALFNTELLVQAGATLRRSTVESPDRLMEFFSTSLGFSKAKCDLLLGRMGSVDLFKRR
jgi:N-hydroxyarylamine O-acetyltransferase